MRGSELTTQDRVVLLLSVIPYLREHGPTPLTELASAFNVDARTLRKLIQFLGMAGVPGETATYQDEDLFDIDWEALEEHDLVSLTKTVAVEDTPRFSALEAAAIRAGVHALLPMLPEREAEVAHGLIEKLRGASEVQDGPDVLSVARVDAPAGVAILTNAIAEQRQITFTYRDANSAESVRRVDPLLLREQGNQWYLRAWCHDRLAERTFALERMSEISVSATAARHTATNERATQLAPALAEHPTVTAQLRVTERAYAALVGFAPTRMSETDEMGFLEAEVELLHPAAAVRLVQVLPGEIQVSAPAEARQAVAEWAHLALVGYGE